MGWEGRVFSGGFSGGFLWEEGGDEEVLSGKESGRIG